MSELDDRVVAEFRAGGGHVDPAGSGAALVLLHTRGARSGLPRVDPAMSVRDGDTWLVVASGMGAPHEPAWAVDLRARALVVIEVPTAGGSRVVPVSAEELYGAEYTAAFARFVEGSGTFAAYRERAGGRRLPVMRLTPRPTARTDAVVGAGRAQTPPRARP